MKNLWTPWRYKYITSAKDKECVFCKAYAENNDEENFVLHRGKTHFILLNRYPYSNGHLMIAPNEHISNIESTSEQNLCELSLFMKKSIAVLKEAMNPDGINVGLNLGTAAGAGISDHYHMHIVPRWNGDTNFMTSIAQVRLIPQDLHTIWKSLIDLY